MEEVPGSDNIIDDILDADEEKKEKIYHIKGGLVQREDGSLSRTKMFEILEVPLDDYSDLTFTQAEARRMRMHAMNMRTGIQAMIPVMCLGPVKCPFSKRCPIVDRSVRNQKGEINFAKQDISKFPLMRQCPVERDFLAWSRGRYMDEFEVDMESPTELGLINKLAELDLFEYRINLVLAHGDKDGDGPTLMKQQVTGIANNGDPIEKLEEHPAWNLKDKIHKQRMDILNSLVGTRKEKYKRDAALKQHDSKDPSTIQSDIRARLQELGEQNVDSDVIDAEFSEVETKDD